MIHNPSCQDGACSQCMQYYLLANYRDIAQYPMTCVNVHCKEILHYQSIVSKLLTKSQLKMFDTMSVKAAVDNYNYNNNINTDRKDSDTNDHPKFITCDSCHLIMEIPNNNISACFKRKCMNKKCKTKLCLKCQCKWHKNMTCQEYQSIKLASELKHKNEFEQLIIKQQWIQCPKCPCIMERTEGCYHLTHHNCQNAQNPEKRTDFCYLCGKLLVKSFSGAGWKYDCDGRFHFPNGIFKLCIGLLENTKHSKLPQVTITAQSISNQTQLLQESKEKSQEPITTSNGDTTNRGHKKRKRKKSIISKIRNQPQIQRKRK